MVLQSSRCWISFRTKPTVDSHHTTESNFLKNLCLKTPIAWGNSIDERWTELDDKVSIKLHMCTTLPETVSLLQETIYTEAASIFLHFQQKTRRLAGQSQRTKLSIQLSHQKNLLLAQIKSSLPEEQAALTHLLINVKCRNQSLYKGEKTHKCLWLMRKAKNEFKVNSYKAGKNLLDPKCCCSLKGDQETLDQRKSCNLFDKNYDIPLGNLEGLTPEPPFLKKFTKSSFFLQWFFCNFAKVSKKCLKRCLFQKMWNPYTIAKCPRDIYS